MSEGPPRSQPELVALYPGSFDPLHYGHCDMIERSAKLFDRVIVAVYDRPDKRLLFTTEERLALVRTVVSTLDNVEVDSYSSLTIDHAIARGAQAIIRGLRASMDFDFEFQIALMNRHMNRDVEALFLMTSVEHAHLSSTLVKEIASHGAPVEDLVPPVVASALRRKYEGNA
jgi:pantetheine-phosphate adenylyltransferase